MQNCKVLIIKGVYMREIIVTKENAGKRIDKYLRDTFRNMPSGAMYKAFRKKDIKVNGVRVKDDYVVSQGDRLEIYIVDEILDGVPQAGSTPFARGFSVVYEDSNIMIVNKDQGIPVHPDREQSNNTLIDFILEYLEHKGEYNPNDTNSFTPCLCHRLDRNTGGLVIIAKNAESLRIMLDKIKNKEVRKFYQCLVVGKVKKQSAELRSFLIKDERKSRVFISDEPVKGASEIITKYRVLSYDMDKDISRLEVELITGKTHQIRAHLAHIGHPIVGDGKYGTNAFNRPLKAKRQMLWAYKLVFDFKDAGMLNYLKGMKFEVEPIFNINLKEQH
jgi:23S rRNA pseudouridine955/2504/2580 synthase